METFKAILQKWSIEICTERFLRHCISVGPKRLVTTVVSAVARIVILSR